MWLPVQLSNLMLHISSSTHSGGCLFALESRKSMFRSYNQVDVQSVKWCRKCLARQDR